MTDIQKELEQIREANNGMLRPEDVVDFATNPDTALHNRFTWDNDEAGHRYRLWQARVIINVQVEVIGTKDRKIPVRKYTNLLSERFNRTDDGERTGGYRTMTSVLDDKKLREEALQQALGDYERVGIKYRHLQELAGVRAAVKKVRAASRKAASKARGSRASAQPRA